MKCALGETLTASVADIEFRLAARLKTTGSSIMDLLDLDSHLLDAHRAQGVVIQKRVCTAAQRLCRTDVHYRRCKQICCEVLHLILPHTISACRSINITWALFEEEII